MKTFKSIVRIVVLGLILGTSLFAKNNLETYNCIVTTILLPEDKEIRLDKEKQNDSLFAFEMDSHNYIIDNDKTRFNYEYSDSKNNIDIYKDKNKDQFLVGIIKEDDKDIYFNFGYISIKNPHKMIKGICIKVSQ